ncbi:hypothetical protein FDP41_013690 [Naegleria fowleri]|uniref:histidine--tRNA ligase n=1 Tax=Naegleria fowleri TaxID=5763 RepID=A0A6A5BYL5_NAEFO|nr:uncharacterized protein FDP41_013690 [Naegleria fowleri]KAF0980476.1 hypothetical protein FDP41_013690 [Naegleria fowleri]
MSESTNNNNASPPANNNASDKSNEAGKRKQQTKYKGGNTIDVEPIAGTRDFLPNEMREREWLFSKFHETSKLFGFEPYDAPILEMEDLYKRKGGEEIVQQMYNFKEKSDLNVALRPEMTPSLARLILKNRKILTLPLKWYSIPQCWRYETTTRGRKREHYQWNCDIWGVPEVTAECELFSAIIHLFKLVGLTSEKVTLRFSSRKIIEDLLKVEFGLQLSEDKFKETCIIVDKMDKMEAEDVKKILIEKVPEISEEVALKLIKLMNFKKLNPNKDYSGSKALIAFKEMLTNEEFKNGPVFKEIEEIFTLIGKNGYDIEDWIEFDPSIVRGLSYYTGVVFEAFATIEGLSRAICGGGRYDKILGTYGSKEQIPACGFGFGDCVILEILRELNLIPSYITSQKVDDFVIPFDTSFRPTAAKIVTYLRQKGRTADIYMKNPKKVGASFEYADKIGATRAIFVAPSEWNDGEKVRVKMLREKEDSSTKEVTIKYTEL